MTTILLAILTLGGGAELNVFSTTAGDCPLVFDEIKEWQPLTLDEPIEPAREGSPIQRLFDYFERRTEPGGLKSDDLTEIASLISQLDPIDFVAAAFERELKLGLERGVYLAGVQSLVVGDILRELHDAPPGSAEEAALLRLAVLIKIVYPVKRENWEQITGDFSAAAVIFDGEEEGELTLQRFEAIRRSYVDAPGTTQLFLVPSRLHDKVLTGGDLTEADWELLAAAYDGYEPQGHVHLAELSDFRQIMSLRAVIQDRLGDAALRRHDELLDGRRFRVACPFIDAAVEAERGRGLEAFLRDSKYWNERAGG